MTLCHYLCHCYGMKASDATSNDQNCEKRQAHGATFAKVLDGRKQPIRGLWIRGTRYYARLNVENPLTGIKKNQRVPLVTKEGTPVQTVAQAVAEHARQHQLRVVQISSLSAYGGVHARPQPVPPR